MRGMDEGSGKEKGMAKEREISDREGAGRAKRG